MEGAGILDGPLKITILRPFGKPTRPGRRRLGRVMQKKIADGIETSMFAFELRSASRSPPSPLTFIMNQPEYKPPDVIL